jgi:hypothetical protein
MTELSAAYHNSTLLDDNVEMQHFSAISKFRSVLKSD